MTGAWCSFNGKLIPAGEAVVGVDDINFAYGFGVYETLKVRGRILYFPELHEERLYNSAGVIGLEHPYGPGDVAGFIRDLVRANRTEKTAVILADPGRTPFDKLERRCITDYNQEAVSWEISDPFSYRGRILKID